MRRRRRAALALLALAFVASTGLRVAGGAEKDGLTHDESISYLAAACHQAEYARITVFGHPPFGQWVDAEHWRALLRPDRTLCLGQIATDLSQEDIHPPLYFWLLHGWVLVVGVGLWTGVSLNVLLAAATCLALFGLARRLLGDDLRAAAVAGVWSFSPAAIRVFAEARQYELLALVAVLFMWACARFALPTRTPRRDALLLAGAAAAGALTQFTFSLVAVAGAVLVTWGLRGASRRLLAGGLGSIAAGYAMFSLLHPLFTLSVARSRSQAAPPSDDLLPGRVEASLETIAGFVLPPGLAHGAPAVVAAAALLAASVWVVVREARGADRGEVPPGGSDRAAMPLVFLWLLITQAALYLTFVSPGSAMDFKHLSSVWPFAAFVPVLALAGWGTWSRARVAIAAGGGAALVAAGAVAVLGSPAPGVMAPEGPATALERADVVLLDNVARGVLPRVLWRVPDRARVFAAHQQHLLDDPDAWLPRLGQGDVVVLGLPPSDPRYGNSRELAAEVGRLIRTRWRLVPAPDPLEAGRVFVVEGPPRRPM